MSFLSKIAFRFMKKGGGQTILIIAGIAVGVAIQIFIGLLIQGLQTSLIDQTIGDSSHISISSKTEGGYVTNYENIINNINNVDSTNRIKVVNPTLLKPSTLQLSDLNKNILVKGMPMDSSEKIYGAIIILALMAGCAAGPVDPDNVITAVVYKNMEAAQNEDMEALKATMDPLGPKFQQIDESMKPLFYMYEFAYDLEEVKVVKKSATMAHVSFVQVTRKIKGPQFRDNRLIGMHILRKTDGKWRIFRTLIKKVEYL